MYDRLLAQGEEKGVPERQRDDCRCQSGEGYIHTQIYT